MTNFKKLSDEELLKHTDADKPAALYEMGHRHLGQDKVKEARKYLTLASVLGDKHAHVELARIYEEEDNFEQAYELYELAYAKGESSVLPKLARLLMMSDPALGIEVLKANALDGNIECLKELIAVFEKDSSAQGKKELKFWQAKLAALTKSAESSAQEETDNEKSKSKK